MTSDLNAAVAAQAASMSHNGSRQEQEEMARWILNHQNDIEDYMSKHPGISSENAARDVYMLYHGRPVPNRSRDTGARGSNDPMPSSSTSTDPEPATPSAEISRRPPAREAPGKKQRLYNPPLDPQPPMVPRVFPKASQPIPDRFRIDWGRQPPAVAARQPAPTFARDTPVRPIRPRLITESDRRRRSMSPNNNPRIGQTQRSFYKPTPRRR